jgi:flagellar biosynthesis protein FlhA
MGGDFVIGVVVFVILITVNFLVITKGATRIAEVGARFSLDAMPGKQMAIDADLSAGAIDDKTATSRRRELEEESAFFGAMDGASKFVRGDAIAGLIITGVNVVGGVMIGVVRHDLPLDRAIDVFTRLSVGDGIVTQIPALIVSLAAGLLVSKGGARGTAEEAVLGQFKSFPKAVTLAGGVMVALSVAPGLPAVPFLALGGGLLGAARLMRVESGAEAHPVIASLVDDKEMLGELGRASALAALSQAEIEVSFGRQIAGSLLRGSEQLGQRAAKLRRNFALQYGIIIPEIKLTDDIYMSPKEYAIKIHGAVVANGELRLGDVMVVLGEAPFPDFPGDETREAAFGMRAAWMPELFANDLRSQGFVPVDALSVFLTHLAEVLRANLAQLLSYKSTRMLFERLEPEYKRLVEEISPAHISYSGMQSVLKALVNERISVRNLHLIIEAIAEVAPFSRRTEAIAEHVRIRLAHQICGDLAQSGSLKIVRLGTKWELAFHKSLRKDGRGDVVEFDIDPSEIERFCSESALILKRLQDEGMQFCLVCSAETRLYVKMILERMYPNLPILSHAEIARGIEVDQIGTIS